MVTVVKANIAMGSRMQKQHVIQADVQPATRQPNEVVTESIAEAGMAILHNSSPMVGITPPVDAILTPQHNATKPSKLYSPRRLSS
mmetsp:Transcript_67472/g.110960  ORF Transcript_67472/g.110960 Transcript_67472/m.110960 type:complete len:86 (+) Transcript_67472:153-410(+)